jgi:hypothetical protein
MWASRKTNISILTALCLIASLPLGPMGCLYHCYNDGVEPFDWIDGPVIVIEYYRSENPDSLTLDQQIAAAESLSWELSPDGIHPDLEPLYDLLAAHAGDLDALTYICSQAQYSVFCWKMASHMNPDLRDALCERFAAYLLDQHQPQ